MGKLLSLFRRQSDPPKPSDILSYPLIHFPPHDLLTIGDAVENILVTGEIGAGKTSGSGDNLAKNMLNLGFGGLVMTHKADEVLRWIKYVIKAGRMQDTIVVSPDQQWRFNFLDYNYSRPGPGAGLTHNAVSMMTNIMEARHRGGQRHERDSFWIEQAGKRLFHGLEALRLAGAPITIDSLMEVLNNTEHCGQILRRAASPQLSRYFDQEWQQAGSDKGQNAGISATISGMSQPFLFDPLKSLFCTETNFTPDDCRDGLIIIMGMPVLEYEDIGRIGQLAFKHAWMRAMLRYQGSHWRPVFYFADEGQEFLLGTDRKFHEASRSSMVASVFLTQTVNNVYAAMPAPHKEMGDAFLGNFSTKIFHRNSCPVTNHWGSDIMSKGLMKRFSGGSSFGTNRSDSKSKTKGENWGWSYGGGAGGETSSHSGGGSYSESKSYQAGTSESFNQGWQETDDHYVRPEIFTRLASGGPRSNYRVQAIVHKGGRRFNRTGTSFIDVSFRQR